MNNILYSTLVVVAIVIVQVNGDEKELINLSKNAQTSIKNSIAKIKSYRANEDKVKLAVDNAYNEFFNYAKNGIDPILKKMKEKPSLGSLKLQAKLNIWMKKLENTNSGYFSYKNSLKNSFNKFEVTIDDIVKEGPKFYEEIKTASPEIREFLFMIVDFTKKGMQHLVDNINQVETQFKNTGNATSSDKIKQ